MKEGFTGIIDQLERQGAAIERALAALREVEGIAPPAPPASVPAVRKGGMTPAGRRRVSEALKKRWAAKKAAEAAPAPEPKPKRRISAEGVKRIIAATKKRWRLQKAAAKAAVAKKAAAKKVAGKKAVVKAPTAKAAKKVAPVRRAVVKKSAPAPTPVDSFDQAT
jgi:hypothetical protein